MRQFGFTLVEMILVTAIIAIMLAVLMPSLQKSRQQTKAIVCMSNIRQLYSVFSIYVNDCGKFPYGFDDTPLSFPPEGRVGNLFVNDRMGWWWFNYLGKLYKKSNDLKTILKCPSRQITYFRFAGDMLLGNYGVNLAICGMPNGYPNQKEFCGPPKWATEIFRPAQTLLIADSGYAIISWQHVTDSLASTFDNKNAENTAYIPGLSINRQRQFIQGQEIDAIYGRHPQKTVNVGFADGHTARMGAEELLIKKVSDNYFENKYPLWVLNPKEDTKKP
jgi:prepilin-type N-terminal cleavage/methylation domain-containing protein/prepilin-type processing-associated H-X9-DG protein